MAEFDGPLGAPAVAHRGAPARRPDRAARRARRRLPRRARPARGGSARQRQLVRRDRQPADPDQEPGDAAAPDRSDRPDRARRRRRRPRGRAPRPADRLPRPSRRRPAPGRGWRSRRIGLVPARAGGGARGRRWPARDRSTRRRSIRAGSSGRSIGSPPSPRRPSRRPRSWAGRSPSPSAPRSSGRRCATRRRVVLQELLDRRPRSGRDRRSRSWPCSS